MLAAIDRATTTLAALTTASLRLRAAEAAGRSSTERFLRLRGHGADVPRLVAAFVEATGPARDELLAARDAMGELLGRARTKPSAAPRPFWPAAQAPSAASTPTPGPG